MDRLLRFSRRSLVGFALLVSIGSSSSSGLTVHAASAGCSGQSACEILVDGLQLSAPDGMPQCPWSTEAAACSNVSPAAGKPKPGTPSLPDGLSPCSSDSGDGIANNAACKDALAPVEALSLAASAQAAGANQKVVLTAITGATVSGTPNYIEIFDVTAGNLVGACNQGSQCDVAYAVPSGTHKFVAYLTQPTASAAVASQSLTSNSISVRWTSLTLSSDAAAIGPGRAVTVTVSSATAATPDSALQLYDADNGARVTYCTRGFSCSIKLAQSSAGFRHFVAAEGKLSATLAAEITLQSARLTVTWLSVSLSATAGYQIGSSVDLRATVNADLNSTPWSVGILDQKGHLVAPPCKSAVCTAQVMQIAANPGPYTAVVGVAPVAVPASPFGRLMQMISGSDATLANVQARSASAKPLQLLWGVDSCKAFTGDPSASGGLYPQIVGILGRPDFWGRYLTNTICPGISSTEIAAAHNRHMGILPIYNDYNCSNVAGYDTGRQYASAAVSAAQRLGIPQGRGLAIDIEPPGEACPGAANLDTGFLHGWYDGIKTAGYAPIFYGDGTSGSAFATQWCYTVQSLPYIGDNSYLWSFQPSLLGGYMRSNAPSYTPNLTPCTGYVHAWQYQIGSDSWAAPDVDGDEVTSELPLWFP